jgi:diacylglycerol kinase family enzyme
MRLVVLLNCGAGSVAGNSSDEAKAIREAFAPTGADVQVREVRGSDLAMEAERLVDDDRIRAVVAAGGDGTVSAIAGALAGTDTVLGVLPLGTFNHFAKDLGMPLDLAEAAAELVSAEVAAVDVAELNGRVFVNNSSLGMYPQMVAIRERLAEARGWGKVRGVAVASVRVLRDLPIHRLGISGSPDVVRRRVRTPFLFVGNGVYAGSDGRVGEREHLDDGVLEVAIAHAVSRRRLARVAVRALRAEGPADRDLELIELRSLEVTARRPRLRVAVDGEICWMATPLRYRTRPGDLMVLRPRRS